MLLRVSFAAADMRMGWLEIVTPVAAAVGAALGIYNTLMAWWRDRPHWRISAAVRERKDGALELHIEVVNTGRVPVAIEKMILEGGRGVPAAGMPAHRLCDARGFPRLPHLLDAGRKLAVTDVHMAALHEVVVFQPLTVVAVAEDGRQVKCRCRALRKLYDQIQCAAAARAAK